MRTELIRGSLGANVRWLLYAFSGSEVTTWPCLYFEPTDSARY